MPFARWKYAAAAGNPPPGNPGNSPPPSPPGNPGNPPPTAQLRLTAVTQGVHCNGFCLALR